ncbi:MAG TPA: DUF2867 domain-containing protein [Pseudonocardia sp.]|nr:DUF2867 domain-containing protein [Pseudonocardia sp.]
MRNVHERVLAADVERVATLLDGLGGPDDGLWPSPAYGPLRFDGPLAPGVTGANSDVRVRVTAYEPGRRVELTAEPGQVFDGTLTWEVEPAGEGRTRIRHISVGTFRGAWRLLWPVVRPQHDHCIESMFDRAEVSLGTPPATPVRASLVVRAGLRVDAERARAVPVPATPLLAAALPRVHHADAFAVARRPGTPADPQVWADALFRDPPRWVVAALGLRQALVGLAGIPRSRPSSFDTVARRADEVLLGTDDEHLDFRASVLVEPERVVLSTVVTLHGARGRAYFALVRLVHPAIVRAMLTRAAHRLSRTSDPHEQARPRIGA